MTRENKLALVLGFGLMLFVGILVSDHLAARQAPPLAAVMTRRDSPGVPPMPAPGTGEKIVLTTNEGARDVTDVPPLPPTPPTPNGSNSGGESSNSGTVVQGPQHMPPIVASAEIRTCQSQKGDTFAGIAQREYGKAGLGVKLAEYNGVAPTKLKTGALVKLPPLNELTGEIAVASTETPIAPTDAPKSRIYKVREGDNLYRIAQRELGAGDRWKELQAFNAELLKDSEDLKPGMQIKIPSQS